MDNRAKVTFIGFLLILCFLVVVAGCSTLTGLATEAVVGQVAKDEPLLGVDTEIVAGDKQQGVKSGPDVKFDDVELKDNAKIENTTVGKETVVNTDKAETVNLNEGVPFWQVGLAAVVALVLGLFLPQLTVRRKR